MSPRVGWETKVFSPTANDRPFGADWWKGLLDKAPSLKDLGAKLIILCGLAAAAVLLAMMGEAFVQGQISLWTNGWTRGVSLFAQILMGIYALALVWRIWLVIRYRPVRPCANEELPTCTVIVPAYNEGQGVVDTLRSIAHSRYPRKKLQILAVDDGSQDDTWQWLQAAEAELAGRVELMRLPTNQGKRRALAAGFKRAKGKIWVTIDSDSVVEPDSIRRIVSPFVGDKHVGAVAGNIRVLNLKKGLIPLMMDVTFTMSFDFLRASQSEVQAVLCTPGAFSAYRAKVIKPLVREWLGQTFFGHPATIGEDRALTNLVLREGHHVLFQKDAVVFTNVPQTYPGLCRMLLRWSRSNVRETLVMAGFIFKRFRKTSPLGTRLNFLLGSLNLTVSQALKVASLASLLVLPLAVASNILVGALLYSLLPCLVYAWRHRSSNCLWAFPYSLFWAFGLSWITPYSLLTSHKGGWLTRRIKPLSGKHTAPHHGPVIRHAA